MAQEATAARRPNRAGERRREQLILAAERLVLAHGHRNVTIQMVADATGITQPAVHHHFATRDELFVELLRYRDQHAPEAEIGDGVDALLEAVGASESTPRLVALFADYAARAQDDTHPAHAYFAARYDASIAALTRSIALRQHGGTAAPDLDAHEVAVVLQAIADGLQTHWLIDPTVPMRGTLEEAARRFGL